MNVNERSLPRVDSDLLRTFLAVAECGNLTRAADGLGRTQSAISVQIRKLEGLLAVRLFQRKARGMVLTEQGEALLPAACAAIQGLDQVAALFLEPLLGRVRIGVPDEHGRGLLERILARFHAQHPGVEIAVRCVNSVAFPACIERDELDLAVYACRPGAVIGTPVRTERSVWAAAKDWRAQEGKPVPLALFDRACWWREVAVAALEDHGAPYRIAVTSESTSGVVAAIHSRLAVGMLARSAVSDTMRVLGARDGFPALPKTVLSLLRNPRSTGESVDAMASAVRAGYRAL